MCTHGMRLTIYVRVHNKLVYYRRALSPTTWSIHGDTCNKPQLVTPSSNRISPSGFAQSIYVADVRNYSSDSALRWRHRDAMASDSTNQNIWNRGRSYCTWWHPHISALIPIEGTRFYGLGFRVYSARTRLIGRIGCDDCISSLDTVDHSTNGRWGGV